MLRDSYEECFEALSKFCEIFEMVDWQIQRILQILLRFWLVLLASDIFYGAICKRWSQCDPAFNVELSHATAAVLSKLFVGSYYVNWIVLALDFHSQYWTFRLVANHWSKCERKNCAQFLKLIPQFCVSFLLKLNERCF